MHEGSGQDDVGAFRRQAGELAALGQGQTPEVVDPSGEVGGGETLGFDAFAVEVGQLGFHAGEDHGGSTHADMAGGGGVGTSGPQGGFDDREHLTPEELANGGSSANEVGFGGVVGDGKSLEEPHRADGEAAAEPTVAVTADDEFGAAPAEIGDEDGAVGEFGSGADAAESEVGFGGAVEDFEGATGGVEDGGAEEVSVVGFACGGGGDDAQADGAEGLGFGMELGDDLGGALDGGAGEKAAGEGAFAEAGLHAFFEDGLDGGGEGGEADVGDEEFDGVRTDVDDAAALDRVVRRGGDGGGRGHRWGGGVRLWILRGRERRRR